MSARRLRIAVAVVAAIWACVPAVAQDVLKDDVKDDTLTSPSFTNWKTALSVLLTSRNKRLIDRALRLLDDPIANLPKKEQAQAREYLEKQVGRGFSAKPGRISCLFQKTEREKRTALFEKLQRAPWATWSGASLNRLLKAFAGNAAAHDSASLLHEDFIEFCRKHRSDAPADLVQSILDGYAKSEFFNVLCLGHHVHADEKDRWQKAFDSHYGSRALPASLWEGFECLNSDIWSCIPDIAKAYQTRLGNQLYERPPLRDWTALTPKQVSSMASASSHDLPDWQFKLASALKVKRDDAGLALLFHLCQNNTQRKEAYDKLMPLFAAKDQDFFIYLHRPVSLQRGVLDLLNGEPANWLRSLQALSDYLDAKQEQNWNTALFPLLKDYYADASGDERQQMETKVITPIYNAYAEKNLPKQRKQNSIRATLLNEAIGSACFLDVSAHQALATWFRERVDVREEICVGKRSMPNYRFVADASLAVGERRLSDAQTKATACALVAELALWGNWMLDGMLQNPQELNLASDPVNEVLSLVLGRVRDLKHDYDLSREELGLKTLFEKLNRELSDAVAELGRRNRMADRGRETLQRVVRSVHLSLVVSAILEDESQLQTILTVVRRDLFGLDDKHKFRVLGEADLGFAVETFLLLDDDLTKCLAEIAGKPGRHRNPELKAMARRFFMDYHDQIQLGLAKTNRFLAALHKMAPGPKPFLRLLDAGEGGWLRPFDESEAKKSLDAFRAVLAGADFLNSEDAIVSLTAAYRDRLGLSLWKEPNTCGLNANVNLMVLMRLLRGETPPPFGDLGSAATPGEEWPRAALTQVVDCFIESLETAEKGGSDLRLKSVTYAVGGPKPTRSTVEHHPRWAFAEFAERLLRAQEMASFPVTVDGTPVESQAHIDALLQAALSDREVDVPPLRVFGGEKRATRSLEGSRRLRLISALADRTSGASPTRLASFAILLPNDSCNAGDPDRLLQYDDCRASVFKQLRDWLDREGNVEPEALADALIVALRLEFSQRDHSPAIEARALVERFKSRLTSAGRQRVLMEILAQAETRDVASVRVGCPTHDTPDVVCSECRASLAQALAGRVQGLTDVRSLCAQELNIKFEGPPRSRLEVIGQLSRSIQRLRDASEIIRQIDADTVKAAYRLLMQLKRAYSVIPEHWTAKEIEQHVTSADDPLAVTLVGIERLGTAMYSEFLPFHGDFDVPTILGNPDALVVFSLFDAELKTQLLRSMPLTTAMEAQMDVLQAPIGTPETAELVLVHSIVQPSLATGVWEHGHVQVAGGKSLIEFVAMGKSYDESFYDRNLVYVVSSEFKLSPRKLFEEAFQGIDVATQAAKQREGPEWNGDAFVFEAWFGDLRAALRGQGDAPRERFNLDRFVRRAATIPGDDRYAGPQYAHVRLFAEKFQHELEGWLDSGGPAAFGRMLEGVSSVRTLVALGGGICERLGLGESEDVDTVEPAVRATYAGFCSKALFERAGEGRYATYPRTVVETLCREFYRSDAEEEATLPEYRKRFSDMFQPSSLARWGDDGQGADTSVHRLTGYVNLYRRMTDSPTSDEAKRFLRDCSYALMAFAAELYWHGGRDGIEENAIATDELRVSYPWRLDKDGRSYVLGDLPENALIAKRLHSEATQANAEWRAECAQRYRAIPFLCRFFGGATAQRDGQRRKRP